MAKKNEQVKMQEEIKSLQKHMSGLVKTILDLKSKVEYLVNKDAGEKNEVEKILEKQILIDKAIIENAAAIENIDKELKAALETVHKDVIQNQIVDKEDAVPELVENTENIKKKNEDKIQRKCKFFNSGFCKYKDKSCRFVHPKKRCKEYLKSLTCGYRDCPDRHPKICKWQSDRTQCKRGEECEYLHVTLANDDREMQAHKNQLGNVEYTCVGCNSVFTDEWCVVKHVIHNMETYFCLNCDDWIKHKQRVYDQGWTLMDQYGYLRTDI